MVPRARWKKEVCATHDAHGSVELRPAYSPVPMMNKRSSYDTEPSTDSSETVRRTFVARKPGDWKKDERREDKNDSSDNTTTRTKHIKRRKKKKEKEKDDKVVREPSSSRRCVKRVAPHKVAPALSGTNNCANNNNPFANKRHVRLGRDMTFLCLAFKVDLNTQTMLAYYDARTMEDFCLLSSRDLKAMFVKASSMNREIPPLQIRKIEVLHEWVKEIAFPLDDSHLPNWVKKSEPMQEHRRTGSIIPKNWTDRLKKDMPRLKQKLKAKCEQSTLPFSFPTINILPKFDSFFLSRSMMCGVFQ